METYNDGNVIPEDESKDENKTAHVASTENADDGEQNTSENKTEKEATNKAKPKKKQVRRCSRCHCKLTRYDSDTVCAACKRKYWRDVVLWQDGVRKYPGSLH